MGQASSARGRPECTASLAGRLVPLLGRCSYPGPGHPTPRSAVRRAGGGEFAGAPEGGVCAEELGLDPCWLSTSGSPALCELLVLFPQQITELIVNTVNTVLVVFFLSMIFLDNFLHTAIQFQGPQKPETGKPESGTGWSGLGPTGRVKSTEEKLSRGEDGGL